MIHRIVLVGLAFCLISTSRSDAAPPTGERDTVNKVNKAIDTGVQYLRVNRKATQHWEGFWLNEITGMEGGVTALGCLAMLNCGVKPDDKDLSAVLDFLRKLKPEKTYVVALKIMCLAEARNPKDLPQIQALTDWLGKTARKERGKLSGWGYPINDLDRPDASNTQYALLGLYAGKQAGAKIPDELWKEIRALYIATQVKETRDTGYWSYIEEFKKASFTMTVAGVAGLVIARMGLNESAQLLDEKTGVAAKCGQYAENEYIRRGMNWIGSDTRFAFDKAIESKSTFYNIYGIERVGRLSGQRFIGKFDWYREGCDWLVRTQNKDGSWASETGVAEDQTKVMATAFALLFLSKGRSPVLISKLAHGDAVIKDGILIEKGADDAIVGWNRKQNDARNLADYASRELFKNLPLGWQVYDPRRKSFPTDQDILDEVGVLVQSPILLINGHEAPRLTGQQEKLLKKYIEEGGFVIAEACCGSKDFADGMRDLIKKMFKEDGTELKAMAPEHAIWRTHFAVPPTEFKNVECLDRGCRTVMVFFPEPITGYWEESKYMAPSGKPAANRGESAFHLGMNIIAYATGMEPPKQRLSTIKLAAGKDELETVKGFVKPVQIKIGEQPPAPAAMRNLMNYLREEAKLDVVVGVEQLPANHEDLFKYKFLYMHGKKSFEFDAEDTDNIKANLQSGAVLFADACCGQTEFDKAFRKFAAKMFPDNKLEPIPVDDLLFSEKLNRTAIKTVKRREKAGNAQAGNDTGFEDLPPALEGIKIKDRWVVIYSKYDIGCALENHKSTDCLSHTPDSARRLAAAAVLYSLKR